MEIAERVPECLRENVFVVKLDELLRWAQVFLHAVVAGEAEYETEATKYRSR